jgi:hypothetical protein
MKQEASEKFLGVESEAPFPREGVAVPNGECDCRGIDGDDPVIGDPNPVRVVAEVAKELGRPPESSFRVNDPRFLVERVPKGAPGVGIMQVCEGAHQGKLTALSSLDETLQEQMFEAFAKHPHWQEETGTCMNPAQGIGGEPTCRDDAVNVRVMGQVLRPGVENGCETNVCAEMTRIGGDIEEGLS